jgi:hypothetical protein
MLTGGCQCGAIRCRLEAMPEDVHLCHCRMCQKASGNLFAALVPVRMQEFRWTRGAPAEYRSSSAAIRQFCAACGTPLSFRYAGSEFITLTIGSFDEPARVRPAKHYGVEAWIPWVHEVFTESLPEEPTGDPQVLWSMADFQHPDHDTGDEWRPPC